MLIFHYATKKKPIVQWEAPHAGCRGKANQYSLSYGKTRDGHFNKIENVDKVGRSSMTKQNSNDIDWTNNRSYGNELSA